MKIIPAIDIIDGKCVRLTQGDYSRKKVYNEDPLAVARMFEDAGLKHLHLVDLDGAKAGKVINWKAIETVAGKTSLHVDFGGGIKTDDEIGKLLAAGVRQMNVGSIAVKDPEKVYGWIETYGPETIILSADVKDERIAVSGWQEDSRKDVFDFIAGYQKNKIRYVVCTDISTDGMLQGPNLKLYEKLVSAFPAIHLIASGGVSSIGDIEALSKIKVAGVIVGKAIYEGRVPLSALATLAAQTTGGNFNETPC